MAELNPEHMIEELRDNIKTGDTLKAQLVLAHLEQVDQKTRNHLLYTLSRAEPDFSVPLFIYLPHAHKDIRNHYHKLLQQDGRNAFANKLRGDEEQTVRPKIVAVDDSRMILNIYKATLHELGYDPVLFEFPASALEWLQTEKPLMVLTDLNMPHITGIQLAKRIREKYTEKLLPIIMVTTQNEHQDNEEAYTAGVNAIVHKPFNSKSLSAAIGRLL